MFSQSTQKEKQIWACTGRSFAFFKLIMLRNHKSLRPGALLQWRTGRAPSSAVIIERISILLKLPPWIVSGLLFRLYNSRTVAVKHQMRLSSFNLYANILSLIGTRNNLDISLIFRVSSAMVCANRALSRKLLIALRLCWCVWSGFFINRKHMDPISVGGENVLFFGCHYQLWRQLHNQRFKGGFSAAGNRAIFFAKNQVTANAGQ